MEERNLTSLPDDILRQIVVGVGNLSVPGLYAARCAAPMFDNIAEDAVLYREVDLVFTTNPRFRSEGFCQFRTRCFEAGNNSAMYIRGMVMFFRERRMEAALTMVGDVAARGYMLARYSFEMISRVLSADLRGNLSHIPTISRDDTTKMRRAITSGLKEGSGNYMAPHEYTYWEGFLEHHFVWACNCAGYNMFLLWSLSEGVKGEGMCNTCFWKLEALRFTKLLSRLVGMWPA